MGILVTGAAGFIGAALSEVLCRQGHEVLGVDNLNDYYSPQLKMDRLTRLKEFKNFHFQRLDIADKPAFEDMYKNFKPQKTVHLAAQAGVRYSLQNPQAYINANITGFLNVLEATRHHGTEHLVYASSSSVYGANTKMPFSPHDPTAHPVSLYAATKKSNEMMAHSYSHLFKIPTTGLRFFTVYGPWGRPDMAAFLFTEKILKGEPIQLFNHGQHKRDFTFIDDIVDGVVRVLDHVPQSNTQWSGANPDPATSSAPYRIFNIGNHQPVVLAEFISTLENLLGKKAVTKAVGLQSGDVPDTFADVSDLEQATGCRPSTSVQVGLAKFVDWYLGYYGVSPN